jgi:hypothetical protein
MQIVYRSLYQLSVADKKISIPVAFGADDFTEVTTIGCFPGGDDAKFILLYQAHGFVVRVLYSKVTARRGKYNQNNSVNF